MRALAAVARSSQQGGARGTKGRSFAQPVQGADPPFVLGSLPCAEIFTNSEAKSDGGKVLIVSISSDSGLCGGIHSSITKATKLAVKESPEASIMVLGDRPKAQISRTMADKIELSFSAVGKSIPTFATASTIADEILSAGVEFDEVREPTPPFWRTGCEKRS